VGLHRADAWPDDIEELFMNDMTKEDALKLIKLLSAMESWAFSTKTQLPDYLHEDLCTAVEKLEKIVLEKP
jgi:hypothetical protein